MKKRKPWLGFLGMVMILGGALLACSKPGFGVPVLLVGLMLLIFALFTGNVKMLG